MLRSDFVMKLMSAVLFVAIAAYIGLYIFNVADKPLKTAVAVSYIVEESGNTEGYIIRNEVCAIREKRCSYAPCGRGRKNWHRTNHRYLL